MNINAQNLAGNILVMFYQSIISFMCMMFISGITCLFQANMLA